MHVPGTVSAILLSTVPPSTVSDVPGRVLLSCIIQGLLWLFGSEAPCFALPHWDLGRRSSLGALLCSANLWFMHAGIHLKPGAALAWDKAQFNLGRCANPQPGNAEHQIVRSDCVIRPCVFSRARSLVNFSGAAFRECGNFPVAARQCLHCHCFLAADLEKKKKVNQGIPSRSRHAFWYLGLYSWQLGSRFS